MKGPTDPASPTKGFRLLHLEDAEPDHALAMAHLRRSGMVFEALRIETPQAFLAALDEPWDLVLSDYHLPGFTGLDALQMLREHSARHGRLLPFILVSGQIGEDTAVQAMRDGASDYLLKHNLARLAPAVEHAIAAARTQRAREAADRDLQASRPSNSCSRVASARPSCWCRARSARTPRWPRCATAPPTICSRTTCRASRRR